MDFLTQILVIILTPTAVVAVLVFALKKFFESVIAKDLEKYKSELQIKNLEHQIRFSFYHNRKAEVISEFYSNLIRTIRVIEDLVRPFRIGDPGLTKLKEESANNLNQLSSHYFEHRIFFDDDIIPKIESILGDVKESFIEFNIAQPDDQIKHGEDHDPKLWINSYRRVKNKVRPLLTELEVRFKKIFTDTENE